MPRENPLFEEQSSPGKFYRDIKVSKEDFDKGEHKLVVKEVHWFVKLCRRVYATVPSLGVGEKFSVQNQNAIEFLSWDLKPEELGATYKATLLVGVFIAFAIATIIFFSPLINVLASFAGDPFLAAMYVFFPLAFLAVYATYLVQSFPISEARTEQVRSLTYVPEILGYMIMSMKLSPNLEKAIEFAAEHGRGKISQDFSDVLWEVQIGMHSSVSEGLDKLAYRWGKFSEEFKKALMRIRASVIEPTEAKRFLLLDKTMDEVLESIKLKMEQYARDLSQPSVMLFYLGVLLPLILIIILPVGSSFSGAPLANPIILALIYNIGLPLFTFWFAQTQIISKKPPTIEPPLVPRQHPGIPPKYKARLGGAMVDIRILTVAVLIVGTLTSFFVSTQGIPPKFLFTEDDDLLQILPADKQRDVVLEKDGLSNDHFNVPDGSLYTELTSRGLDTEIASEEVLKQEKIYFTKPQNDVAPYNMVFGLLLTFAFALFVFIYFDTIYQRQAQLKVIAMEKEFKDSLYILASRMGENKPVEEAFKHAVNFLPDYKISEVFSKILDNISLLAMPIDKAVFDADYGALRDVPSSVIRSSMKLLIDSVSLGVNVAARSMISLSIQLSNQEKVNDNLKVLVSDITSTMKIMSLFIAPIVLGLTTSLQKIVVITISNIANFSSGPSFDVGQIDYAGLPGGIPTTFSNVSVSSFIKPEAVAQMATPTEFIFIIAIYVVELVFIMTYFTTKIEEDNDLLFRINLAKFFPISIAAFVISIIVSNLLVGGFLRA